MRRRGVFPVLAGLLVVAVAALAWWGPFLTQRRDYPAAIPQTVPLYRTALAELAPAQRVCFEPAVMDRRSARARFRVTTFARPGVPLALTITGPGYAFATSVAGTYADNGLLSVPVRAPAHDVAARICLRNAGSRRVALYGADDITRAPLTVTRDRRRIGPAVQFAFFEGRPVSLGRRMPTALARMDAFRPGFVGPWLFWPLALLCAIGLPAGALWALWDTLRPPP
jgi:hypothetical protein